MILEEKGATGGLITTAGHEQILHLARAWTPGPLYAWMGMIKPDPLVPLWLTRGVPERIDATGEVIPTLDEDAVRAAVQDLAGRGHRVADHRVPELLRQPGARAPGARDRARAAARPARLDLLRPRLGVPRVRAHAAPRSSTPTRSRRSSSTSTASSRCSQDARLRRPAEHRPLRRRHDERAVRRRSARSTSRSPGPPAARSARPTWPGARACRTC